MKIIFLLIAVLLIWWVLRTLRNSGGADTAKPKIKNMLSCSHCGLHVPEDEAVRHNNKVYCSKEHARKDNP
ncbi:PP0621 family protein [Thiolapillus sp.]